MAHLSYVMSRDIAPVSDEAFADYLRVIQEEYEGRSLTRSEENLRLLQRVFEHGTVSARYLYTVLRP